MHEQLLYTFTTPRTKAITFHPTKPVVLSAHHTGVILSHDLHLNQQTYIFRGHDGPVRAILFHPRTELFCSGGDDNKVILWSYNSKKQLHTFSGHTDYVRSLDFHSTNPWILSCSDDQTIRIWNFQSYKCLATVSGHSHYVMRAKFLEDCIISVSLDQSIRVWDYSSLLKKKENYLGVPNVFVKQIIDGHDRGINWIEKHPIKNLIATGGDDRLVKIWEVGDIVFEKESYYSHTGNVTGIAFIDDYVVSTGEDGILSIEGKNESRKIVDDTRMWCVSKSNDGLLFGIGYDTGIRIYTTKRNSIVYYKKDIVEKCIEDHVLYYLSDNRVMKNDLENEIEVYKVKKEVLGIAAEDNKVLVQYKNNYEVIEERKCIEKGKGEGILVNGNIISAEKGVISSNGKIIYESECDARLQQSSKENKFYIITQDSVILFDLNLTNVANLINVKLAQKIIEGLFFSAILTKRTIFIVKKQIIYSFSEMVEINDGFFEGSTFFYSTMRHIKYLMHEGGTCEGSDCSKEEYFSTKDFKAPAFCGGVLRSIEKEVYLLFKRNEYFFYLTNEGIENVKIDLSEFEFKKAIIKNDKNEIERIIKEKKLCGTAIFEYLAKKGKGELILEYVSVEKRIEILIESKRYEEAFKEISIQENSSQNSNTFNSNASSFVDTRLLYERLFNNCMRSESLGIAEKCLLKMNDFNLLFIFYICTNQKEKIEELKKIGNEDFKVSVGIFLNDKEYLKSIIFKKVQKETAVVKKYDQNNEKKHEVVGEYVIEASKERSDEVDEQSVDNGLDSANDEQNEKQNDEIDEQSDKCIDEQSVDKGIDSENDEQSDGVDEQSDKCVASVNENSACLFYDVNALKDKNVKVIENVNDNFEAVLNFVTLGKFTSAISLIKEILYSLVTESKNNENSYSDDFVGFVSKKYENLLVLLSSYLSGLILEKKKKEIKEIDTLLRIDYYFANLPLQNNHKTLAKANFMILCYKNEKYNEAKKIAKEIENEVNQSLKKSVEKILKNKKIGSELNFENGQFCFDTMNFENEYKTCGVCQVKSKNGKICTCCEIGILK